MISTIKTERLILRPLQLVDAPAVAALWREPAVARMVCSIPLPQAPIAAEGWILLDQARQHLKRDFVRAVVHPERGLIGVAGAHVRGSGVEIGYSIHPEHWGFGFATEAVGAVTKFAASLHCGPVQATVFADNPASRRVLEKLGFAAVGDPYPLFSLGRSGSAAAVRLRWRGQLGTDTPPQELAA